MKTTIYFIRHGEVYNPKNILYGRLPRFPLSRNGKEEVKKTAKELSKIKFDALYTSPLLRARQTAEIFAKTYQISPRTSKLIIEIKLFHQGMSAKEYKAKFQPYIYEQKYIKKGQESVIEIEKRMFKFLNRVYSKHKGKNILVVSHGDPIVILKSVLEKKQFTWDYKKNNYLKTGRYIVVVNKNNNWLLAR